MPQLVAALALVAAAAAAATSPLAAARTPGAAWPAQAPQTRCDWNAPGHNPFMGDVVAAVDAYQDIPDAARARLKQRMANRAYDEVVRIRRDSIEGQRAYRSEIRDMHFGNGQRCATVDRSAWTTQAVERGLVYCEAGHCILVPTVCRNVSRIDIASASGGGVVGAAEGATAPVQAPGAAWALSHPAAEADTAALPTSQVLSAVEPVATGGGGFGLAGPWNDPIPGLGPTAPATAPDPPAPAPWPDGFDSLDRWQPDPVSPTFFRPPVLPGPLPSVPEPATPLLMLAGLLLLAAWRRRVSRG